MTIYENIFCIQKASLTPDICLKLQMLILGNEINAVFVVHTLISRRMLTANSWAHGDKRRAIWRIGDVYAFVWARGDKAYVPLSVMTGERLPCVGVISPCSVTGTDISSYHSKHTCSSLHCRGHSRPQAPRQ